VKRILDVRSHRRASGDRGVTIILFALAMVAILLIVATVIDYGNVRSSRQGNKLSTDTAASAALQKLAPEGTPLPWEAVCTALEFLELNHPELTPFDITYMDGDGDELLGNPCASALGTVCDTADIDTPDDLPTWAWINAVSGDQAFDIKSGYVMPDPAFPEDSDEYSSDVGAPEQGGCDQVAVITSKVDDALFGGIANRSNYTTVARTVGRVEIGQTGSVAIALVLLEQNDCEVLDFAGGGGSGEVAVRGTGARPGIIHSDSDGTGDGCPGSPIIVGKQNSGPRVRALSAPSDPTIHGIMSSYHQSQGGTNTANWTSARTANATEVWMCDQDSGAAGTEDPCEDGLSGADRVTRTPADDRFLTAVTDLRQDADNAFDSVPGNAATAIPGYTTYTSTGNACNPGANVNITAAQVPTGKLYVNCNTLQLGNNRTVTIAAGITEVLFRGTWDLGNGAQLNILSPTRVYVNNVNNADESMPTGSTSSRLSINENGTAGCVARHLDAPLATTEVVARSGGLGGNTGSLKLCSTFVHLMGGDSNAAPVNVASGTYPAPYANTQDGFMEIGGGGAVEWTAPNTEASTPSAGDYEFEDLALWSETQEDNIVRGGGSMLLSGIFFLPNTGPSDGPGGFSVQGTGAGTIDLDAQLWVRKFSHNGTPRFRMRANPEDSILVPFLVGSGIVR
jgi:hypothetical protein